MKQEIISTGSNKRDFLCAAFSPIDQKYLIAGTKSADFFVISMKNKSLHNIIRLGTLGVLQISTFNDKIVMGCGDGTLAVFQEVGSELTPVDSINVKSKITSLQINKRKEILIGTDFSQALIANLNALNPSLVEESHNKKIRHLQFFDHDQKIFASASDDGSIRFWDVANRLYARNAGAPICMQIRDEIMISGWEDCTLRMHAMSSNQQIWQIDNTHKGGISCLELSPDNKFIISGGEDGIVRVWELRSRSMKSNLSEHAHKITKVKLREGGSKLLTSSRDKSILLWDIAKEKRISAYCLQMGGINSFDIMEGSNLLVSTGQDRKITYWDLRDHNPQQSFNASQGNEFAEECMHLCLTPDQSNFFTCGTANIVKLWDLKHQNVSHQQRCHSRGITAMSLSKNGSLLLTGGEDASLAIWNVTN